MSINWYLLLLWTFFPFTTHSRAGVFKLWYAYKNIKLKNQMKQHFLLKVAYKEQRSEKYDPFYLSFGFTSSSLATPCCHHSVGEAFKNSFHLFLSLAIALNSRNVHLGLRMLEISQILYHSVLLCYETLSEHSMKPSLQMVI